MLLALGTVNEPAAAATLLVINSEPSDTGPSVLDTTTAKGARNF